MTQSLSKPVSNSSSGGSNSSMEAKKTSILGSGSLLINGNGNSSGNLFGQQSNGSYRQNQRQSLNEKSRKNISGGRNYKVML